MTSLLKRLFAVIAVSTCVSLAAPAQDEYEAATRPSKDVTMSFTRPGRVAEMHVCVGDRVTAGEPLAKLDDTVERAQLAQLKAQADDTTRIAAAQAQLDQSKVDLDKIETAWQADPNRRAVTEFERDQARLEVEIRRLSLVLAEFEHTQDQRRYEEARLSLERMNLLSPVDGTVEVLFVETGESVDALQQVIHIVDVDPLWIDVPVPLDVAHGLRVGHVANVAFGRDQAGQDCKIIHIASVGDAASSTLRVRVELPNPTGRPAGEQVRVMFPKPFAGGGGYADDEAPDSYDAPTEDGPAAAGDGTDAPATANSDTADDDPTSGEDTDDSP